MNKKTKKIIVPAVVTIMGVGLAFATNSAQKDELVNETAYFYDENAPVKCIPMDQCQRTGTVTCSWIDEDLNEHDLYGSDDNGVSCQINLFKN